MPRYLISFDDGAMDHIPDEEGPAVGEAAHAVIREAQDAGVWVFAGGVYRHDEVSPKIAAPDGAVIDRSENKAYIAGVTIIDVPSIEEALQWATRIAPRAAVHKRSAISRLISPSATDRCRVAWASSLE